jgi:hypothetical protein
MKTTLKTQNKISPKTLLICLLALVCSKFSHAQEKKFIFSHYRISAADFLDFFNTNSGGRNVSKLVAQFLIKNVTSDGVQIDLIVYGVKGSTTYPPVQLTRDHDTTITENVIFGNYEFKKAKKETLLTDGRLPPHGGLAYVEITPTYDGTNNYVILTATAHYDPPLPASKGNGVATPLIAPVPGTTSVRWDPSPPAPAALRLN